MPLFFVSTVMAILPVYTTSKLHAARINLRQTPSSTLGVLFNCVKGCGFWPKVGVVCKIFAGAQVRLTLRTPLHEILDPPLDLLWLNREVRHAEVGKIIIFICGKSIVVFHCFSLLVARLLQSAVILLVCVCSVKI